MSDIPDDRRYTADHEWVKATNEQGVRVGITAYAAEQLGDIVYVDLPQVGAQIVAGEASGELESTKSVSDLYAPLSGVVTAVNQAVVDDPAVINSDPYDAGWLFELASEGDSEELLDADAYAESLGDSSA